ncbi:MAG: hypothetical protein M1837_006537 [Sclerophora amabilis]|nr:MAG: hypothetical protein M1837_006537 [Sclerophora amabilis]
MKYGNWFALCTIAAYHVSSTLAAPQVESEPARPQFVRRHATHAGPFSNSTGVSSPNATPTSAHSTGQKADLKHVSEIGTATGTSSSTTSSQTPTESHQSGGSEYVVLFDRDNPTPPEVSEVLERVGLNPEHQDITHVFSNSAFRGFSGNMKNHCITALNEMTDVKFVEPSVRMSTTSTQTRKNSPWGLQRLSQPGTMSGDDSKMQFEYKYDNKGNLGKGVDIYVVDTGLNADHLAFGGRARMGFSMEGGPKGTTDEGDVLGHGTHVAGTAAGDVFGVASGANIIGVQVLGADGSGSSSDTINGIDYILKEHEKRKDKADFIGSIASMSLGSSGRSPGMEQAISAAVDAGIHFSVAAGNQGEDACTGSPASTGGRQGSSVTVGSVNIRNEISSFSNTGPCVDVYAPGENILSTWIDGVDSVKSLSGTSMATPHVTGLMAYLMAQDQRLAGCPTCMKEYLAMSSAGTNLRPSSSMTKPDFGLLVNNGLAKLTGQSAANSTARLSRRRLRRPRHSGGGLAAALDLQT